MIGGLLLQTIGGTKWTKTHTIHGSIDMETRTLREIKIPRWGWRAYANDLPIGKLMASLFPFSPSITG
jgi:hypothetical protein